MVVVAGDLWDQWTIRFAAVLETVRGLAEAARTVVAVPGNHEVSADRARIVPYREAVSALKDEGIMLLEDGKVWLEDCLSLA